VKFLAILATLLLTLVGYSVGVVLKSGKTGVRKPAVLDLALVVLMGAGIVLSSTRTGLSRGLLLAVWVGAGFLIGGLVTAVKRPVADGQASAVEPKLEPERAPRKRFRVWREWTAKIGSFQSQIILGILFLIVFAPVGLTVRLFGASRRPGSGAGGSHWTSKTSRPADIELFKRQS
jgi:hypothetical protein